MMGKGNFRLFLPYNVGYCGGPWDAKFEKLALTGGLFWCLGEKKPDESGGFPSAPKFETFKSHADGADKGAGRINESGVCRFRP